ncbi:MAG TPA: M20/M25/M40 family metallo-hydrolase [Phycisphaerae bacterium]|nr:M20/M25/M40 family metallo-hydrolase [Phycisphaerae bacterium]
MTTDSPAFDGKRAFAHLEHLSVAIGPRLTGSAGEHKAAAHIARVLRSFGLKVTRQRFGSTTYDNRTCVFEVREGRRWRPVPAEPVMLSQSTPAGGVEGEVLYAESGEAEYLSPAMAGKIVLVCGRVKAEDRRRLIRYGPKALIRIDPTVREGHRRAVLGEDSRRTYGSLPMASIRHLDGLEIVQRQVRRARLVLRNTERKSYSLNVIGEKPGTDYADEIVVVCAHYDSHWRIPGAQDNAGGTAVMLELARVLGARPSRRTLRFIAFAAEETGLHGSTWYANEIHRRAERERKKASFDEKADLTECDRHRLTFNIDVHGCTLGQWRATYNGPEDLGASVRLLARELGMACDVQKKPMSSDGTPLAAVGVPNVQFARYGGATSFGHGPDDDIRYLSADALARAGEFAERYLRRYVTDAPVFAFPREIPDDQVKDIKEYFNKGKLPIPGERPAKKRPRGARAGSKR